MDKCTFGDSRAAVNLITTLDTPEYSRYQRKVCTYLGKQLQSIKAIGDISDKTIREAVLKLWHDRFVTVVMSNTEIPDVIKTHTICVAKTYYRIAIKPVQNKDNSIIEDGFGVVSMVSSM